MILKGSQRSGGKQLGLHLLREDQNEHVEVHEVSGFVSETVLGAMKEALALSKGTRCQQYLFSVSLNPPAAESAGVEVFERALRLIEEKMGLVDQPRVVVFHEKEGRRHCHAVWSRIDAQTMSAKPLPFFKSRLRDVAKQLFIENGWELPKGFESRERRDPRNSRFRSGSRQTEQASMRSSSKVWPRKRGRCQTTVLPSPALWRSAECFWLAAIGAAMWPSR